MTATEEKRQKRRTIRMLEADMQDGGDGGGLEGQGICRLARTKE